MERGLVRDKDVAFDGKIENDCTYYAQNRNIFFFSALPNQLWFGTKKTIMKT
eukprot:CAMPEP_0170508264 /NCGR_PEP_ID=MMETSP0208-20121228/61789_1 /TAXON_ID=197538 /ORGANISM="Strombidium inclinatum, Strain S3" /LENGTH=51 /DNA_ID=CAMNT_0010791053 /DNA_START=238 /DNA_END=389 /DNA_ORIENTATION=-